MTKGEGPPSLKGLNGAFETFIAERTFIGSHKASIDAFMPVAAIAFSSGKRTPVA